MFVFSIIPTAQRKKHWEGSRQFSGFSEEVLDFLFSSWVQFQSQDSGLVVEKVSKEAMSNWGGIPPSVILLIPALFMEQDTLALINQGSPGNQPYTQHPILYEISLWNRTLFFSGGGSCKVASWTGCSHLEANHQSHGVLRMQANIGRARSLRLSFQKCWPCTPTLSIHYMLFLGIRDFRSPFASNVPDVPVQHIYMATRLLATRLAPGVRQLNVRRGCLDRVENPISLGNEAQHSNGAFF